MRRHDYLPFGEENSAGTTRTAANGYINDGVRQKFTEHERDTETGLDFMQARYYSSGQGRFTSPDEPFADQWEDDPQSWNLYAYAGNNPLAYTDPLGLWKKFVDGNNIYYIAERGDTWTSLAEELGTSVERVERFFDGQKTIYERVGYDVTALQVSLTAEREFSETILGALKSLEKIDTEIPNGGSPGTRPVTVDPKSPWQSHYPSSNGTQRTEKDDLLSPNKMAKGIHEQKKAGSLGQRKGTQALQRFSLE